MKGKQWDCISTFTGLLFVAFLIFIAFKNFGFLLIPIGVFIGIIIHIFKDDNPKKISQINSKPIENVKITNNLSTDTLLLNKIRIEDFNIFLGMSRSSSKHVVFKIFGKLVHEKTTPVNIGLITCGDIIHITYNKTLGLVRSIQIQKTVDFDILLKQLKIDDPKINFLGKSKHYILEYFEIPTSESTDFIFYEINKLKVSFRIVNDKCVTLTVYHN
ncbi:hypothetical protein [Flavobacterium sp. CF136]|uniref:hypothetical protein n=1 Tax=Flavobacterium sp. (strain CF136) TaxID=1144313 RepID=UPI000271B04D|nr:hypothetical protein [Flavobacterium sp. CF136]EJL64646.1 hypothetical protein PMI10_01828 [Flavobacterium sp. CF136]